MKVIIAGSRNITDYELLKKTIKESGYNITHILSGGAKGVDTLAERYAKENNIPITVIHADWSNLDVENCKIRYRLHGSRYNALAGFNRNYALVEQGDALIALHNNSSGTKHIVSLMCRLSNKHVFEKVI